MQTELSKRLGVEHAIFGFTPFPAVAAAISRAGGFGVLGAVRYTAPDELKRDLDWVEAHVDGRPSGLEVVMPAKKVEGVTEADVDAMIPETHRQFVKDTLARYGVPELAEGEASGWRITGWMEQVARGQLDVAFDYPIRLLANALGSPPADVIARAHERDVLVAALAGSARALSGNPARQLRTEWTDAWDDPDGPGALPMPLQGLLVADALSRIQKYEVEPLLGTPVGQIVGRMNSERTVQAVFDDLTRG